MLSSVTLNDLVQALEFLRKSIESLKFDTTDKRSGWNTDTEIDRSIYVVTADMAVVEHYLKRYEFQQGRSRASEMDLSVEEELIHNWNEVATTRNPTEKIIKDYQESKQRYTAVDPETPLSALPDERYERAHTNPENFLNTEAQRFYNKTKGKITDLTPKEQARSVTIQDGAIGINYGTVQRGQINVTQSRTLPDPEAPLPPTPSFSTPSASAPPSGPDPDDVIARQTREERGDNFGIMAENLYIDGKRQQDSAAPTDSHLINRGNVVQFFSADGTLSTTATSPSEIPGVPRTPGEPSHPPTPPPQKPGSPRDNGPSPGPR